MRIFLDMDGVLCDYYGGIWDLVASGAFGSPPPTVAGKAAWPYRCRLGDWNFYDNDPLNLTAGRVAKFMDRQFYANLRPLPDAADILRAAEQLAGPNNVYLLSAPWDTDGSVDGKRDWIARELPSYRRRTLIGTPKEACSAPGNYLLDDRLENAAAFNMNPETGEIHGGIGILVPRPWNELHPAACPKTGRADMAILFGRIVTGEATRKK